MRPVHPGKGFYVTRNPRHRSSFDWKIPSVCAGFAILLLATFYFFRTKPVVHEPGPVRVDSREHSDFDRTLSLPGDPEGLAWNGTEFVMGNRIQPFGFLQLIQNGEEDYQALQIEVHDQNNEQSVHLWTVTWNGKEYIGYTEGKNFDPHSRFVFTVHDPKTFQVIRYYSAPEMVGGLVWDGKGYWVATRENTRNSGDDVYLYRYDPDFKMIHRTRPPGKACQGLAWDGSYLWFADTFSSTIHLLNVVGNEVEVVHKYYPAFQNMSAIGFDGENIWVGEYDHHQIHRLNPELMSMWADGDFHIADYRMARKELGGEEETAAANRPAIALRPEIAQRPLIEQQPVFGSIRSGQLYRVDGFLGTWAAKAIYGKWSIYFSKDLFANQPADPAAETFVKYSIYVTNQYLKVREVRVFDATEGENSVDGELLVEDAPPGNYAIQLLIQAEYADAEGKVKSISEWGQPQRVISEEEN